MNSEIAVFYDSKLINQWFPKISTATKDILKKEDFSKMILHMQAKRLHNINFLSNIISNTPVVDLVLEISEPIELDCIKKDLLYKAKTCGITSISIQLLDNKLAFLNEMRLEQLGIDVLEVFSNKMDVIIFQELVQTVQLNEIEKIINSKHSKIGNFVFQTFDLSKLVDIEFYNQINYLVKKTPANKAMRLSRLDTDGLKNILHIEIDDFGLRFEQWKLSLDSIATQKYVENLFIFYNEMDEIQPTTVNILPTDICNAECPYCITSTLGFMHKKHKDIENEKFSRALEYAKRRGAVLANISGGGEPTLSPELNEIVYLAKKKFPAVVLHTNGSQLLRVSPETRKTLLEKLVDTGITGISIHRLFIDDESNFKYMGLRGKNQYNIQAIALLCNQLNITLQLSIPLLKDNFSKLHNLLELLEWASLLKVDRIVFRELLDRLPARRITNIEMTAFSEKNNQNIEIIDELYANYPERIALIKTEPWGENGKEKFYQYTSTLGNPLIIKILHGKWHDPAQTKSQTSGFVLRTSHTTQGWALYNGWMTISDRII